jgi:hypothetical protein
MAGAYSGIPHISAIQNTMVLLSYYGKERKGTRITLRQKTFFPFPFFVLKLSSEFKASSP